MAPATQRERPRILHIVAAPEFVRLILLHDLRRLDQYEHIVLCGEGDDAEIVRREGYQVIGIPIRRKLAPGADLVTVWRLARLIRRLAPDLIHTFTPKAGLLGQIAATAVGVRRRVHSVRGLLYVDGMPSWRRGLFRTTDRVTFGLAHRVIFISGADRDLILGARLCREERTRFTGSGIDLGLFAPPADRAAARHRVRAELGLHEDQIVALSVGRFVRDKGYLELADTAATTLARWPALRFVWVAPVMAGEEGVVPEAILTRPDLAGKVLRLARRDDMVSLYAAADLLVHASHREGVPRVLMEAAAVGLPIVASDIPGNREVIPDDRFGWLFAVRDGDGLGTALAACLADQHRDERAIRAQRRVRELFDQDRVSERVGAVYRELGLSSGAE